MNKFIIIVPVYNAEEYIEKCLFSILDQSYNYYELIVIDDGSTDQTPYIINSLYGHYRFSIHTNPSNNGSPLANFVQGVHLRSRNPEDILITVDGDDWLSSDNVLSYLNKVYQDPNIYLTYGQYQPASDLYKNFCKPLPDTQKYRKQYKWTTSHLRTFKRKIFDHIEDSDLRDTDGKYYKTAGDLALMYPAIELCGSKRIKFISKVLYVYNDLNPLNEMKIKTKKQLQTQSAIIKKTVYKQLSSWQL